MKRLRYQRDEPQTVDVGVVGLLTLDVIEELMKSP